MSSGDWPRYVIRNGHMIRVVGGTAPEDLPPPLPTRDILGSAEVLLARDGSYALTFPCHETSTEFWMLDETQAVRTESPRSNAREFGEAIIASLGRTRRGVEPPESWSAANRALVKSLGKRSMKALVAEFLRIKITILDAVDSVYNIVPSMTHDLRGYSFLYEKEIYLPVRSTSSLELGEAMLNSGAS